MKKTIIVWAALGLVCVICIAVFIIMQYIPIDNAQAFIYSDGKLLRTVSLAESCEFTIENEHGFNTICVANNSISVIAADCPDKVCMSSGAVSSGAVPIICLPHRLEIRIVSGNNDIDAQIN